MTEITPFTFPTTGQSVRTLSVDGEPWFVAADVAAALGHSDPTKAMAMVDDEDRLLYRRSEAPNFAEVFPDQRVQSVNIVNESGLFSLILRSNVPGAKAFKRWVTHEVLPSIRNTGAYSVAGTPVRIEMTINALAAFGLSEFEQLAAELLHQHVQRHTTAGGGNAHLAVQQGGDEHQRGTCDGRLVLIEEEDRAELVAAELGDQERGPEAMPLDGVRVGIGGGVGHDRPLGLVGTRKVRHQMSPPRCRHLLPPS